MYLRTTIVYTVVYSSGRVVAVEKSEGQNAEDRAVDLTLASLTKKNAAQQPCGAALKGDGFVPGGPPPAPLVPFAVVSLMTLDGSGSLLNDVTVSRIRWQYSHRVHRVEVTAIALTGGEYFAKA